MLVVSNTSPLSNLAVIGQLELLHGQVGSVVIPPAVHEELGRNPHPTARHALAAAIQTGWIGVRPLSKELPKDLASQLDLGEAEALALALDMKASLVLLDDSAARASALRLGLNITGVLGVLSRAKRAGQISSLKDQMNRLRTEARFFINPALEKVLLISSGEM